MEANIGGSVSDYVIGRNSVIEYLKNKDGAEKLFIQKGELKGSINKIIAMARELKLVIVEVDRKKLDEIAENGNHQGVCLLATDYRYASLNDILQAGRDSARDPLIIVCDEITDPHNLGAIIRTAEAAGADGLVIPKRRSASVNHTVHKTSAGATTFLRVAKVNNINQTLDRLKDEGYWIYGADGYATTSYTSPDYRGPVALVIGNEGRGIGQATKKSCDVLVNIPMYGRTESLNASTSASILIYEVLRNRDARK